MHDTAMVARKSDGQPPARRPLVDEELADELLGKASAGDGGCAGRQRLDWYALRPVKLTGSPLTGNVQASGASP